jgi:hypothetical protein
MTQTLINVVVYQGDDLTIPFVITNANGNTVNITACTFKWTMSNVNGAIITKTLGHGLTLADHTTGQLSLAITNADTTTLSPVVYTCMLAMDTNAIPPVHSVEATGTIQVKRNYALM